MDDNIKSVLHKVVQLTRQNPEFNTELREALDIAPSAIGISIDDGKLEHIYEYCIEQILEHQSKSFYKHFTNCPFYSQLVYDYKRMERFARRNEFGDYSLALFQQIECLLNVIFASNDFVDAINKMWDYVVYFNKKKNSNVTIANVIFGYDDYLDKGLERAEKKNFTVRDKLRIVIFFFKHFEDILNDIYLCRNTNHRGNDYSEDKYEDYLSKSSYTYFLFGWSLTQFMEMAEQYDTTMNHIIELAPVECDAIITSILEGACFIKYSDKTVQLPSKLLPKVKSHKKDDKIIISITNGKIIDVVG